MAEENRLSVFSDREIQVLEAGLTEYLNFVADMDGTDHGAEGFLKEMETERRKRNQQSLIWYSNVT
jgi:hypothetical protein